ncbi:hypothetical protein D047_2652B, partial [Vibrio parahaemolyticus VPTS-2010_2]
RTTVEVWVHHRIHFWQNLSWQMVVCHQYGNAIFFGVAHTFNRRYAIVDRHDHFCAKFQCLIDHLWAQTVAIFKAVRHQVIDVIAAKHTQCQYRKSRTRCAICVKVTHHDDAFLLLNRLEQQLNRLLNAAKLLVRMQSTSRGF